MDEEKAMIYHVEVRVAWKRKTRGSGYVNNYRGTEGDSVGIVTRNESIAEMNKNPVLISQVMQALGATGKAVYDFHFVEEFSRKELSKSNFYTK
tara:strand:+ start:1346 stop:1627 length:282 start_codon:yes stop_codon:yes gene_type:complete